MKTFFTRINSQEKHWALGLMSGTSCDGLDIALIKIWEDQGMTRFDFIQGKSYAYGKTQKELLKQAPHWQASQLSQLNFYLPEIWAEMIDDFLRQVGKTKEEISFIGSHGHTIWHQSEPREFIDRKLHSTLQLGDPMVLAKLTGTPVIGDFRVGDMALGGQGAPLIPYFDWVFFSKFKKNILAINIGGIANFTFVPGDGDFSKVQAFDTGPGNMLLDTAMKDLFDRPFDENGQIAQSGQLSEPLFKFLLKIDRFPEQEPPKSTGRELYGSAFYRQIKEFITRQKINPYDTIHTLAFYTALTIYDNYVLFIQKKFGKVEKVIVSGGGAQNLFLMEQLRFQFGNIPLVTSDEIGLNSEFKEAIGFALLGWAALLGKPSNVPQATGARRPTVLGKICLP
jgi:anhydro-N-acetylmuramic acid kinase